MGIDLQVCAAEKARGLHVKSIGHYLLSAAIPELSAWWRLTAVYLPPRDSRGSSGPDFGGPHDWRVIRDTRNQQGDSACTQEKANLIPTYSTMDWFHVARFISGSRQVGKC
jgi:hypothetical protein